jgi:hypothetical protein
MRYEKDPGFPNPERRNDATEILATVRFFGIQLNEPRRHRHPVPCQRHGLRTSKPVQRPDHTRRPKIETLDPV